MSVCPDCKGKMAELSTPNLVDIQGLTVDAHIDSEIKRSKVKVIQLYSLTLCQSAGLVKFSTLIRFLKAR